MKVDSKSQVERIGVSAAALQFSKLGWMFREQPICDYGIDAQVEIVENENSNKTFLIRSPEMELIQMYLIPGNKRLYESTPEKVEFMTATTILTYLNEKNRSNIKLTNVNVGKSLKMLGFPRDSHYESGDQMSLKGYFVIRKDNQEGFRNE